VSKTRVDMIRERIEKELNPVQLQIIDESHLHAGHSGHGGAGHFKVEVVSELFNEQPLIKRHRMVYAAVNDLMQTEIHALSINATTPAEADK